MAHENRIHQLEDIANRSPQHEGKWDALAAGEMSVSSSHSGTTYLVPVPVTLKAQLGSPTALAIGAFSTTLTTLALALMEFRGLTITNVFIGNFFFVAGIGMVISAQWELVLGNTYAYTVLSAFGFFYGGFGAIITPLFGVQAAYGTDTAGYNNGLGFFVLMWAVWNFFFLLGSLPLNLVYIGIFFTVQMAFTLVAASYFATADGHAGTALGLKKTAGAFAFLSGLLGYYTVANLMCQEAMFFSFPMGDTSRFFSAKKTQD
ncbi:hypothetical protein HO173_010965 [Letharia columbiana]|uniref:Uncharacterized protein n=1 Tax=Letharia columbiana TaxID=112416 RepID=A0A8H6L0C7_9LECA|nr:uncharacterized protein HO173_010965 [Letharia columbiana]KAF6230849.1 hypothetical protein HO173_010965 [Letharia columbiana]